MTASALSVLAFEFNGTLIILACFVIPVLILYVYAIISLVGRRDLPQDLEQDRQRQRHGDDDRDDHDQRGVHFQDSSVRGVTSTVRGGT